MEQRPGFVSTTIAKLCYIDQTIPDKRLVSKISRPYPEYDNYIFKHPAEDWVSSDQCHKVLLLLYPLIMGLL